MDPKPSSSAAATDLLRPALPGLAEEDLEALAQATTVHSFPAGGVICREGETGDAVYIIAKGRVEIVKRLNDQRERHLRDAGPGELLGEMAILEGDIRTATIRAVEPTTVLEIGSKPFLAILEHSASLGLRIMAHLTARLRAADQQAILELRHINEELVRALERLERLDRTKSDFIQVAAHELRTPVAALVGYAQMMQQNQIVQSDPELSALAQGVLAGTARLHRIFNSILDLSRLMSEDLEIRRSPVSLTVIFQGIQDEFQQALKERRLTLEVRGLGALPLYPAEPDLLYRAFRHLVHNAIKYTPDGGQITVTGRTADDPDLGQVIEVAVEDTGIGIAAEDLNLIFEKFYRRGKVALYSSGTTNFKGGGPGLGLAIARGVVLAHGGRIFAESPGYDEETCPGSRFVVRLPLSP